MKALILSFVTASLLCAGFTRADEDVPPNILFILADDMGWQDTSVPFGPERTAWNDRYQTRALERMAREGMKFTQAYACAVCSPTRVSLMTGQNEVRHGVTQWTYLSGQTPTSDLVHPTLSHADWNWNGLQPQAKQIPNATRSFNGKPKATANFAVQPADACGLPLNEERTKRPDAGLLHSVSAATLPSLLKQSGYRTMHFGKGHLGAAETPGADPQAFGFDVRIGGRDAGGCGSYYGRENFGAKAHPNGPWRAWDLDQYFGQDIHLTEALTREAQREIRSAVNAGQPFFCYFAHYAPHTPIKPDERFAPKYRDAGLDETEAAYASLIEGLDKSVGDLLALLEELGIADNTLVVFTSDNGGVSHAYRSMAPPHTHNRPLSSGKGSHHEGGIRVPLLVRWSGVTQPGTVNETPVMIYDWFPTLLEAAGTSPPDPSSIDGLDLRALLQGRPDNAFDRPLAWHFPNFWGPLYGDPIQGPGMGPSSTLRRGDWKLIYYHADQRFELFDLAHDVFEQHNLAAEEPVRVLELASELTRVLNLHQAPMPRFKATGKPVPWPIEALRLHENDWLGSAARTDETLPSTKDNGEP
jgi:arylsulfatase A-like enzyme